MARDIEEFLRRAAERRKQQQGGGQKRPPAQRQPEPPPRQTISERDLVKPASNFPAAKLPSIGEESVADHVQRYLDVSDIVEHVDHLAEDIEQADERMESHLDQVFDHDVGKLGSKKSATDELLADDKSNPIAGNLLKMLQNPDSVRQAIMIAEVLKRPDFDDEE